MNKIIEAYVPLALRTELNPSDIVGEQLVSRRLLHAALGVGTEVAELACGLDSTNELEELGDTAFYLALGTDLLTGKGYGISILARDVVPREKTSASGNLMDLVRLSGDLLDFAKRDVFYRKTPEWHKVQYTIQELWRATFLAMVLRNGNIQGVLNANIAKLKVRYPDKFSCELAVNRNTEQERKVLEAHILK